MKGMTMAVFRRSAHAALPLVLAVFSGCFGGSDFGTAGDGTLNATLESIRSDGGVPAVGALLFHQGRVIETGAAGLRATGHDEAVTVNDQWHLGSLTKAMTATLAAVLVEAGTLSWDLTVGDVFPDLLSSMRAEYVDVRLDELLYHTSGLPNDVFSGTPIWPTLRTSTDPLPVQRRQWASEMLTLAPEAPRGTYLYTNGGYIVAGAMIEEITGETWEALMQREVFDALGMTSTGFGPPGTSITAPDQPWGHLGIDGGWTVFPPTPAADNPAALGPAGTVHTTFQDYALYMAAHLAGARGTGGLVSAETFAKLHTAAPGTSYSMGWGISQPGWANGSAIDHDGSNTVWYATVWIAPQRDMGMLAVTNAGGDRGDRATDAIVQALITRFEKAFGN